MLDARDSCESALHLRAILAVSAQNVELQRQDFFLRATSMNRSRSFRLGSMVLSCRNMPGPRPSRSCASSAEMPGVIRAHARLQADADIGLHDVGGRMRAAQADFFLHGCSSKTVAAGGLASQPPHRFNHDGDAGAIVPSLAHVKRVRHSAPRSGCQAQWDRRGGCPIALRRPDGWLRQHR